MFNPQPFPHLSKDLKTHSSAQFIGAVYFAEECEVGENCVIDASKFRITVNVRTKIGKNTKIVAEVEKITIGPNVVIGDNCLITTSIGEGTTVEDNQSILH